MGRPFSEAWLSSKGEIVTIPDATHYTIGRDYIATNHPEVLATLNKKEKFDDIYDATYDFMYSTGFARLYSYHEKLYITTSKTYPDYRLPLIQKATKYVKKSDHFRTLLCDDTERVLYSKDDIL
jgi:hypothetical protein